MNEICILTCSAAPDCKNTAILLHRLRLQTANAQLAGLFLGFYRHSVYNIEHRGAMAMNTFSCFLVLLIGIRIRIPHMCCYSRVQS